MKVEELHPSIRIKAPLRCDGIGRLDCAEDTESGARLAVRWLPLEANGDAAVRACARLPEHPTLPRVRQTGQVGDKAFLAMEFPDGQLLSTSLGEPQNPDVLVEIGGQLADALATVHAQGVVHGEMSAESVLLAQGKAYLWDMPLVIANRLTDRRGEERLMHQLVRTAPFLAPERARGGQPSAEADVYALGAVMCLAAGARPPPHGTTLAVIHAVVTGEWVPEVPPVFLKPLEGMLTRMLSREPERRPTAREVADLFGKPVPAHPTIPELPMVVLTPNTAVLVPPPALRPVPKTPFNSAPGALQPMLPPRAVAEAAKKTPFKPLQITTPTHHEPTQKVNVPVPAAEVLAEVPPAAQPPIPTPRTLEFGTALPAKKHTSEKSVLGEALIEPKSGKVPALGAAAVEPKSGKTPAPALAPQTGEVKAALKEKTPTPARAPAAASIHAAVELFQIAITAPNPPPVSGERKLSREMPPVALTDNVTVSGEVAAAGAEALSPEAADALELLPRARPTWLVAAAVLAVLTTGIAVAARALTEHAPRVETAAVAPKAEPLKPAAVKAASPAAVQAAEAADADSADEQAMEDELSALPTAPRRRAAQRKAQAPSKLEGKYESSSGETTTADDFSFLNEPGGTTATKTEELKRPSF
ncbi:MAG: protein kinase [Archangiaceae bacterium]|nr:protein kinase [Archangiaceae bacterium]